MLIINGEILPRNLEIEFGSVLVEKAIRHNLAHCFQLHISFSSSLHIILSMAVISISTECYLTNICQFVFLFSFCKLGKRPDCIPMFLDSAWTFHSV